MHRRVDLPEEDRTSDIAEQEMSTRLHQPDIRNEICHQTVIASIILLHLALIEVIPFDD